jgi:sulfate transport system ATP-binding protein
LAHPSQTAVAAPKALPPGVAVRLEGVVKRFGDDAVGRRVATFVETDGTFPVVAVDGIDLDVYDGEFFSMLGPSGSGKTTTLRMIAGFELPSEGRILMHGEDVTTVPPFDRDVNTVFQDYALFPHMTVGDNVGYGLVVRKVAKAERVARVADALRMVRLEGYERRKPGQLSGGQRQRVALARALAVEPRVLLLDEPFGALDAKVRRDLRRWLRDVHDRTGHTTLFVTHDQEEALELAHRVAIFNRGKVEQVGTPDEILDQPATPFVAGFVGEAVRLPVDAAGPWIRLGPHSIPTTDDNITGPAELFVRPRDFVLADGAGDAIPARVVAVRRTGPARRAELVLAQGLPTVEIELPLDHAVGRGDILPVRLAKIRLFAK